MRILKVITCIAFFINITSLIIKQKPWKFSINNTIIKALEDVLKEDELYIMCTDEELLLLVNEKLSKKDRISHTSFKRWKASTDDKETTPRNKELYKRIRAVIKKALLIEKTNLLKKLKTKDPQWTRFAWILERKFKEWNLVRRQWHGEDKDAPMQSLADMLKGLKK